MRFLHLSRTARRFLRYFVTRRRSPIRRNHREVRLCLEALEDRNAPAVVLWTSGGSGDWDNAANWTNQTTLLHQLPGVSDTAEISTAVTVTHSTGSDSVAAISFGASGIATNLTLSGGTLTVAGDIQNSGTGVFTISGGTLANATVQTNITASGSGTEILNAVINQGTIQTENTTTLNLAGSWSNTGNIEAQSGTTLNLGGNFSTSGLGTITGGGGTINLTGTLNNTSTLTLNNTTGSWNLAGGEINGGTVAANTGDVLVNTGGYYNPSTLVGVTLDGTQGNVSPLDMQANTSYVHVSGNLTLNGAILPVGSASGSTYGQLLFTDSTPQTIVGVSGNPGTVLFGANGNNVLGSTSDTKLTLGPNLTVTGASGSINTNAGSFDNLGTITADPSALTPAQSSGTITLTGTNWTNDGTIQAQNGGSLVLTGTSTTTNPAWTNVIGHTISVSGSTSSLTLSSGGTPTTAGNTGWVNDGTITLNGTTTSSSATTVNLGGVFTQAALGTFDRFDGTVNLTGTLNNSAEPLILGNTNTTGSWNLDGLARS